MLDWIIWNRTICIKMDLALNNRQRLICHKTQPTNQIKSMLNLNILKENVETFNDPIFNLILTIDST